MRIYPESFLLLIEMYFVPVFVCVQVPHACMGSSGQLAGVCSLLLSYDFWVWSSDHGDQQYACVGLEWSPQQTWCWQEHVLVKDPNASDSRGWQGLLPLVQHGCWQCVQKASTIASFFLSVRLLPLENSYGDQIIHLLIQVSITHAEFSRLPTRSLRMYGPPDPVLLYMSFLHSSSAQSGQPQAMEVVENAITCWANTRVENTLGLTWGVRTLGLFGGECEV